ncbi:MAG: hypothetical protein QOD41_1535, partial [Cryptosporangiaceae bacterium]|nr:hypothetical protein [Cryptosporangiaceae bacterium]
MTNDPRREGSRDRQASEQWSAPGPDPSGRAAAAPPALAASGHGYPHEQWPGSPDLASTHDYSTGHTGPARRERGRTGLRHGDPPDGYRSEPSGFSPAEFAERGPELAPADFAPRAGYAQPSGSANWPGDPVETAYGKPYSGQPYAPPTDPTGTYPRPPQFDATGPHPAVELNRTGTLRAPAADRTGAHAAPAVPTHNAGLVAYEPPARSAPGTDRSRSEPGYAPTGYAEKGYAEKGYAETQYSGAPHSDQPGPPQPYAEQPYAEPPYAEPPYAADPHGERGYTAPGYEPPAAQRTGYPPAPYGSPALPAAPAPAGQPSAEPAY